jgi:branched-chain amino acid transport system substrate-binding protein
MESGKTPGGRTVKNKPLALVAGIVIVLAGVVAWRALTPPGPAGPEVVSIGAVLPLTGDVATYGTDSRDGINLAVDRANAAQSRYRFQVVYEDSKGDPKTAVTALQKLLAVNSPPAVIGENISSSTLAMVPVIDSAKVVLISPSASAPKLSGASRYFFRVYPSDDAEGAFVAAAIAAAGPGAKVCILYMNNDFGLGLKEVFEKQGPARGLKVLDAIGYDKTQTDFRTILARVKEKAPDAVYLAGYYQDGGQILKQAKELGLAAAFWGATTHENPQLLSIAGDAAEGFRYPVSTGFNEKSDTQAVKEFVAAFKAKYAKDPGLVSALGYDCARLVIDGVLKNGRSAEDIRAFIAAAKDYPGAAGQMTFDEQGDVHKPIMLKMVKNGAFVPVP